MSEAKSMPQQPLTTVLIMAGGTGGHVYPGLAVAERLRAMGSAVAWLGTHRGLEAEVVPAAGIPISFLSVHGLRGKGALALVLAPFRLLLGLWQALNVIRRIRPGAVLGMGGFASGPGGVAAWLLRRPLLIHEQNAIPGLTNRLLIRLAGRVMEAFPGSFGNSPKVTHIGNPVRAELLAVAPPASRLEGRSGPLRLLVLGGSLGAQALNEVLPAALTDERLKRDITVWHQAGKRNINNTLATYRQLGAEGRVVDYIEDMAEAYAWADLVLCRAGALTLTELATVGVGAILVPYPHAVDDHQTHNAAYLVNAGAALLLSQAELSPERLRDQLLKFCTHRERLHEMASAAHALAKPDAANEAARLCLEAVHG